MKPQTRWQILLYAVALTFLVELFTVVMRFGFALESTRDTASTVGVLTMGIRVHHGYIGLALIALAFVLRGNKILMNWLLIVGIALFASDMIHHFLVLWPVTGSPEFHLVYPH
jgi:hypothetical protein